MKQDSTAPKTNYEEYLICTERGHESNGSFTSNAMFGSLSWTHCIYCGTSYAIKTTTEVIEDNIPEKDNHEV